MTQEQEAFGEQYFYRDIEEYESVTGFKLNEGNKMIWDMARTKNKDLGWTTPDESQNSQHIKKLP